MNELGTHLLWSALQVTLVAAAAAGVYGFACRRGPASGSFVALGFLALSVVLTGLIFLPLPHWWHWQSGARHHVDSSPATAVPVADASPSPTDSGVPDHALNAAARAPDVRNGLFWSPASVKRMWHRLGEALGPTSEGNWNCSGGIAVVLSTGSGLCLLRLLLGIWAIADLRCRSRPIDDLGLVALIQSLRTEMKCSRHVEVRESTALTTAAAIGWLRPLVLLPADWRNWSKRERQAVLAHELAHVCRSDYLAGLVARLCQAIHFYHPVVHWMAGRLQLQQELAADALGARFAGGRKSYLLALASLALRQEKQPVSWPVRTFLPARGTLMRRIQMLRGKEQVQGKSPCWIHRMIVGALLLAAALAASSLRRPVSLTAAEAPPAQLQTGTENDYADRAAAPMDLTYVPAGPESIGVMVVRPALLFHGPDMLPHAKAVNQVIDRLFQEIPMGGWTNLGMPIEDIDQINANMIVRDNPEAPKGSQHAILFNTYLIRSVRPFDWKKHLDSLELDLVPIRVSGEALSGSAVDGDAQLQGKISYTLYRPQKEKPSARGRGICYFIADDRTLITETEDNLRQMIKASPSTPPAFVWPEGWNRVNRGWFALAMDNRHQSVASIKNDDTADPIAKLLVQSPSYFVVGCVGTNDFRFQAWAKCGTVDMAERIAKMVDGMLGTQSLTLRLAAQRKDLPALQSKGIAFAKDFLKNRDIKQNEHEVSLQTHAPCPFGELLEAVVKEMMAQ
jgi:hypothetical protein